MRRSDRTGGSSVLRLQYIAHLIGRSPTLPHQEDRSNEGTHHLLEEPVGAGADPNHSSRPGGVELVEVAQRRAPLLNPPEGAEIPLAEQVPARLVHRTQVERLGMIERGRSQEGIGNVSFEDRVDVCARAGGVARVEIIVGKGASRDGDVRSAHRIDRVAHLDRIHIVRRVVGVHDLTQGVYARIRSARPEGDDLTLEEARQRAFEIALDRSNVRLFREASERGAVVGEIEAEVQLSFCSSSSPGVS